MLDILLIDDDELVRQSLELLLAHEGFQVTAAAGGKEATELARQQVFDLIVSDIRMPDMDGFQCVTALREILPEANFVLITGYSEQDAPVQALRLQVDDFFRKPFDINLFLERVRQIRRLRKQRKSKGSEQSLESFISLLRRFPAYAERTDSVEQAAVQAGRRLGVEGQELRALANAVRLFDLVAPLAASPDPPDEEPHNQVERVAQLLTLARMRPLPRDTTAQLVAALRSQEPLESLGLDHEVQQEVGQWSPAAAPTSVADVDIKVLTLGETRIWKSGEEIAASQWESSRARWLFVYLVSRRGQWVSQERLRDTFWPDSDPDRAQRSLVSAIHRCRKALGDNDALLRNDRGYAINPERSLSWDMDQMLKLRRQAKPLEGSPEQCIPLLRQIENLYKGGFCPECTDEWAVFVRDDADRCALEALEVLGRMLLDTDLEAAEGRARKILRIESTDEAAAAILLRALWGQGRRDEAIRFYRDFSQRVERELSLPPSPDLVKVYLQLTQLGS